LRLSLLLLGAATATLLGTLPSSASAALAGPPVRSARLATVVIDKLAFGPSPTGLRVGDTVEWVNHDIFQHSVTGQGFDLDLKPGDKGRLVLRRAGAVPYRCRYHPGMTGVITIGP